MEKAKVKILDEKALDHSFFDYLLLVEKEEIKERIKNNYSVCFGVYQENIMQYMAIIDFTSESLHLREVAGNFLRRLIPLDNFCTFVAKKFKMPEITICTSKRAVKNYIEKIGFVNEGENFYKRKVA